MKKQPDVKPDEFNAAGERLFNPTKPHGTVYADGFSEVKFVQGYQGQIMSYRGDRTPIGPAGPEEAEDDLEQRQPTVVPTAVAALAARVDAQDAKLDAILAALNKPKKKPGPPKGYKKQEQTHAPPST